METERTTPMSRPGRAECLSYTRLWDLLAPGRLEQISASGCPTYATASAVRPCLPLRCIAATCACLSPVCLAPPRTRTPLPFASPRPARAPQLCLPLLPLTLSSLRAGGTQEPRCGRARPVRGIPVRARAPHLLALGSPRAFP
jgi:hypothetical protein